MGLGNEIRERRQDNINWKQYGFQDLMTNSGFITLGVVTFGVIINAKCNNAKCDKLTFFEDKMKSQQSKRKGMSYILFLIWRGCWCLGRRWRCWGGERVVCVCGGGGRSGACNSLERRQGNTNRKHHFIQDQIKKMG